MKSATIGLAIATIIICSCQNVRDAPAEQKKKVAHHVDGGNSMIEDRIEKAIAAIDSFAGVKDVYTSRNINIKEKEIRQETDQTWEYFDRWQNRLIAAAGGRDKEGELKDPGNKIVASAMLVNGKGGDTVKKFIDEMQDILAAQVRDSAEMRHLLMLEPENAAGSGKTDWKTKQFSNATLTEAIEVFEKLKYEVRTSELVVLNRILKDAEKKKR